MKTAAEKVAEAETAAAVMQVVFDLARYALRERNDFLKRGFAMPDMPHETEVHALLGIERVPVAPVKGSTRVSQHDPETGQSDKVTLLHAATPEDVKRLRLS